MRLLPPGEFTMGSPESEKGHQENEFPEHPVRISRPFWLGVYEVTQRQYKRSCGDARRTRRVGLRAPSPARR
jgi:formylglycine-generating enzyme required for sulfatase activity